MASQNTNEIDEILKRLKSSPGFQACFILNNDGVVLRWENKSKSSDAFEKISSEDEKGIDFVLTYEKAVHYAGHVLDLYHESKMTLGGLMEDVSLLCLVECFIFFLSQYVGLIYMISESYNNIISTFQLLGNGETSGIHSYSYQ